MSTSLLYHGFGLVGYAYVKTAYEEGKVIFTVKHKRDKLHCPTCGSKDLILRGCSPRRFRMAPIGSKAIFLDLDIQRVARRRCEVIRQVDLGFADSRFSYTRAFERYVLELSQHMTITTNNKVRKVTNEEALLKKTSSQGMLFSDFSRATSLDSPPK